jgi:hypothetical protein
MSACRTDCSCCHATHNGRSNCFCSRQARLHNVLHASYYDTVVPTARGLHACSWQYLLLRKGCVVLRHYHDHCCAAPC